MCVYEMSDQLTWASRDLGATRTSGRAARAAGRRRTLEEQVLPAVPRTKVKLRR